MARQRYLGIDFGLAHIGVAISDTLGITARGLEVINWNGEDLSWALARLKEICAEYQVKEIIIGLPKRTDSSKPSEIELEARDFAKQLQAVIDLPIKFFDERFTTKMANYYLQQGQTKKQKRRDLVDQVAAEIILQDYLASL